MKLEDEYQQAAMRPEPPASWSALGSVVLAAQVTLLLSRGRDGGVAGQAGGVADDVVALGAVGSDPVPLRRRVLADERDCCTAHETIKVDAPGAQFSWGQRAAPFKQCSQYWLFG